MAALLKTSFLESGRVLLEIQNMLESKDISKIDFAVAYLSAAGYWCIEPSLNKFLSRGGHVRFIVGLSNAYVTESSALRKLLALAKTPQGKGLEVKYHKPKGIEFHPKLVLAKSGDRLKMAVVGSSNLTSGGQKRNIEANVLLRIEDSSDVEANNFEQDSINFFNYLWKTANKLDPENIREYAKAEKAKRTSRKTHSKVPNTVLSNFVFVNNERTIADSLSVLCTECRKTYVDIPLNAFYCDNCGEYPSVNAPEPLSVKENDKKKEIRNISLKINGKKRLAEELAVRCPDCNSPIDMTNCFMLWIICEKCAERRRKEKRSVCHPYTEWPIKAARDLSYSLNKDRFRIERGPGLASSRYRKFKRYIPIILDESPMKMQQIYDKIRARFPSDCDDSEKCIHKGVVKKQSEWKHITRDAIGQLLREKTVNYNKLNKTYQLK